MLKTSQTYDLLIKALSYKIENKYVMNFLYYIDRSFDTVLVDDVIYRFTLDNDKPHFLKKPSFSRSASEILLEESVIVASSQMDVENFTKYIFEIYQKIEAHPIAKYLIYINALDSLAKSEYTNSPSIFFIDVESPVANKLEPYLGEGIIATNHAHSLIFLSDSAPCDYDHGEGIDSYTWTMLSRIIKLNVKLVNVDDDQDISYLISSIRKDSNIEKIANMYLTNIITFEDKILSKGLVDQDSFFKFKTFIDLNLESNSIAYIEAHPKCNEIDYTVESIKCQFLGEESTEL